MESKELTKAEEELMQYLWKIKKGFLKDIVEQFPEPKPANTTVSTFLRILVNKGFVGYTTYGKANEYYPKVTKKAYFSGRLKFLVDKFFNGSAPGFVSFFANEQMSLSELEELKAFIDKKIRDLKKNE
ncbi:MAG: BlaI/MecI/CopY family transcriptional regulator [Tannerella sp.]|jgi:predicted transcriptional regulator|nr:BlaI/MecI/CopY family transcriptional regulator [Tannerella sp.]